MWVLHKATERRLDKDAKIQVKIATSEGNELQIFDVLPAISDNELSIK